MVVVVVVVAVAAMVVVAVVVVVVVGWWGECFRVVVKAGRGELGVEDVLGRVVARAQLGRAAMN